MYNSEQKKRFIDSYRKSNECNYPEKIMINLFNIAETMEELFQKDLSNFTHNEILDMFRTESNFSVNQYNSFKSLYSRYTMWCLTQGLVEDSQNHYDEVTSEDIKICINVAKQDAKITSLEKIQSWLKQINCASHKVIILGLFEGLTTTNFEDLMNLKMSDIDMESRVVKTYSGREVEISEQLLDLIKHASEETVLEYVGAIKHRYIQLEDDGTIMKRPVSGGLSNKQNWFMTRAMRILKELNEKSTLKDISTSGIIHYIKSQSALLEMAPLDFIIEYGDKIQNQFNKKVKHTFYNIYKRYLE